MDERAENARFRRALGEVAALSALPAVWAGYHLPQIVVDVAEVLMRALHPEFVYVTLVDEWPAVAAARAKQPAVDTSRITAEARRLLASGASTSTIPDPLDATRSLRATVISGGSGSELAIVAASDAPSFSTQLDRLLLALTANLANTIVNRKRVEELAEENVLLLNAIDEHLVMGSVVGVTRDL